MRKLKDGLKVLLIIALIVGFVIGLYAYHYAVWRAQHPDAPFWSYFL